MLGNLSGKVAIVTGAGRGIGRSIALRLAQAGAAVVIANRSEDHGLNTLSLIERHGGTGVFQQTDVAIKSDIDELVNLAAERFGRLDILVHNAGIFPEQLIDELEEEVLELTLSVNLKSAFWLAKACAPHFRQVGQGRLLYTSSVTGPKVSLPGLAHYAASKAGLNGFIRTAALEYARDNITVNGVEPGFIATPEIEALLSPEMLKDIVRVIPNGRSGMGEDIANAMLFLASDESGYINGQTITVDGGITLPEFPAMTTQFYESRNPDQAHR
ncbi:SDR family oxidoreductase [Pseudomaricurvus alkylphenolicus]|uniref:SDR family oxidoreductase n=1 Tax=Pseudomaricurvus alkylphenolicus TaxID=1306991 RepID=UPI0014229DFF|nr:SDR family oxidoreductase [Pseudomaricurvus alkylphenolicus]NIB43489.1 SDR family oxidoreductase [Pseudomaricurvus alkylphenolicus]